MNCQIAFAFLCGIVFCQTGSRWCVLPAVVLSLLTAVSLAGQKKYCEIMLRGGLLLTVGILGAGCQIRAERIWQAEQQTLFREQRVSVCGTLICKEESAKGWQLTLALPDYENRVIVSTQDGGYPLESVLSVEGSFREFDSPRNEGQFNQRQYYKCKKILGQITKAQIHCVQCPEGIHAWREWLCLLRADMCRVYEICLPQQPAGMMAAMITGEKAMLDADVKRAFRTAGFSHILAISGMHISLIGMGVYRLLRKGRCSYVCAAAMTAGWLLLYGELIGWGVSARRAIGMFAIYLLAQCLGRGYDLWSSVSALVICLLWENPFLTGDMGFRLSFVAVAAVAASNDVLVCIYYEDDAHDGDNRERGRHLLRPISVALLVQLFTLPLVAYSYYELPVYALFLNLLLIPYAGVAVGCGLIGGLAGLGWLNAAYVLLLPCRVITSVYVGMCDWVSGLAYASVICGRPSPEKIAIYYLILSGVLLWQKQRKQRKEKDAGHRLPRNIFWLPVTAIVLVTLLIMPPGDARGFEISYLDVGQGDGAMIRTDSGTVCFIDGGSTDVTGVGTYRILPFLKSKGIKSVDYWIISHADEDHVNGFYEVLESGYDIKTVVITAYMPQSQAKQRLLQTVTEHGVPVLQVKAGQTLYLDRHAGAGGQSDSARECLRMLAPAELLDDSNAACLVCLYEDAYVRALFPGDIGAEQEQELQKRGLAQRIDLYKAAHHGSRYSNTGTYLAALSPKLSIVSCARRNRYGHPAQQAIDNIRASGSRILYTMYSGQIRVRRGKGGLTVHEFLPGQMAH